MWPVARPILHHDLATGDKGGDQRPAAEPLLLRNRQCRRQQGGARMHAGARPGQAVELEGVRERAVGECRRGRRNRRAAGAEDMAVAAGAGALGIGG